MNRRAGRWQWSIGAAVLFCLMAPAAFSDLADELPAPVQSAEGLLPDGAEFAFVRLAYTDRVPMRSLGPADPDSDLPPRGAWMTDYPEADWFFSRFIAELTGLSVDPDGEILELTDPALRDVPFAYLVEGGRLEFSDDDVVALRDYLQGGGFLMLDDFWNAREWMLLEAELDRVLPGRPIVPLWQDHELFWSYYPVTEMPNVPGMTEYLYVEAQDASSRTMSPGDLPAYYGIFDDDGRLMVLLLHNLDFGDAWEHVDDPSYPRESALGAIALGINAVVYALKH